MKPSVSKTTLVASSAIALLIACADERPAPSDPPTDPPMGQPTGQPIAGGEPAVPHSNEIAVHMGEHFWQLAIAQDAAIEGDLEGIHEATGWLAQHETLEGLPESAAPYLMSFRGHAARAAEAPDFTAAATAIGGVAASCGACHQALEVTLPTLIDEDLDPGGDLPSQMSAHIRAADLMWESLVAPSDEAWQVGANLLSRVEILPETVAEGDEEVRVVADLLAQLRDIARSSATAAPDERPRLYGQLLATCGQCHDALGGGLRPGA
ncbi:MAG: hypothetical protein ACR2QM_14605 [Longimicrobiales bacterium]